MATRAALLEAVVSVRRPDFGYQREGTVVRTQPPAYNWEMGSATFIREFIDRRRDWQPRGLAIFRGQANREWKILPQIAREPSDAEAIHESTSSRLDIERDLLLHFRDRCGPFMPEWIWAASDREQSWRVLLVAQHHGLPTRLVDWSRNPLVALYFAVENFSRCKNGCEVCSAASGHDSLVAGVSGSGFTVAGLASDPANGDAPLYGYENGSDYGILLPPNVSPRIVAQSSVFTIGRRPRKAIPPELEIVIPAAQRTEILRDLNSLGVNRATLFPDLDGHARHFAWLCQSGEWRSMFDRNVLGIP